MTALQLTIVVNYLKTKGKQMTHLKPEQIKRDGGEHLKETLDKIKNIIAVTIHNHQNKAIGTLTYKNNLLTLQLADKTIMGYQNILNENVDYVIHEKHLSSTLCNLANLELKTDKAQWMLCRAEAKLKNRKYKIA